jgi:hypothetical protein
VKVPNNAFASSFVLKSEKPATETYQLLQQADGEDAMGRTQVFERSSQNVSNSGQKRWEKCVTAEGNYVEGN